MHLQKVFSFPLFASLPHSLSCAPPEHSYPFFRFEERSRLYWDLQKFLASRGGFQRISRKVASDNLSIMNPQNEGINSATPAEPPAKRKRGRPRKDDNLLLGNGLTVVPESDNSRINQHNEVAPSDNSENEMVGQVVSGVVEGSFDAGYFLTVRVGSTDTLLRGVVFQPGRFTPISEANDVAPDARMYKRRSIPIPVCHPHPTFNSSIAQPKQNIDPPALFENRVPTIPPLVPSRLSSKTSFALHKPPASLTACSSGSTSKIGSGLSPEKTDMSLKTINSPLPQSLPSKTPPDPSVAADKKFAVGSVTMTSNLPKNNSGPFLGKHVMPHQTSAPQLENNCTSQRDDNRIVEQLKVSQNSDSGPSKTVEQCKVTQDCQALAHKEGHNIDIVPSKDSSGSVLKECAVMQDFRASDVEGARVDMEESKCLHLDPASEPVVEQFKLVQDSAVLHPADGANIAANANKAINLDLASKPVIEEYKVMQEFEISPPVGSSVETEASKNVILDVNSESVTEKHEVMLDCEGSAPAEGLKADVVAGKDMNSTSKEQKLVQEVETLPLEGPKVDMVASKDLSLGVASRPVAEQCEVMQKSEDSFPVEHHVEMKASTGSKPTPAAILNMLSGTEAVSQLAQVQDMADDFVLKPAELPEAEPNLDLQLTSQVFESKLAPPRQIDNLMGNHDSLENIIHSEDMQLERADKIIKRDETHETEKLVSNAVDNKELDSDSTPVDGFVFQGMFNSHISGSSDRIGNSDAIFRDAELQSNSDQVMSNKPAVSGDSLQN